MPGYAILPAAAKPSLYNDHALIAPTRGNSPPSRRGTFTACLRRATGFLYSKPPPSPPHAAGRNRHGYPFPPPPCGARNAYGFPCPPPMPATRSREPVAVSGSPPPRTDTRDPFGFPFFPRTRASASPFSLQICQISPSRR